MVGGFRISPVVEFNMELIAMQMCGFSSLRKKRNVNGTSLTGEMITASKPVLMSMWTLDYCFKAIILSFKALVNKNMKDL